jgi:hypothetical protein
MSSNELRMARNWGQSLFMLLVVCLLTARMLGAAGPAVGNPIGPGTVPPSSYESNLVNTPNPVDPSSSRLMTGNVTGGKYFHGRLPYNSTTSFAGRLGSTSMDSFLRYTTVPDELREYSPGSSPFYSPTGTVTTTQPGYAGAVAASTGPRLPGTPPAGRAERPADVMSLAEIPPVRAPLGDTRLMLDLATGAPQTALGTVTPALPSWSMPKTPEEMRRIIQGEPANPLLSPPSLPQSNTLPAPGDYQQQLARLQRDIERVRAGASELEQGLGTRDTSSATALERKAVEAAESSSPAEVFGTKAPAQPQPWSRSPTDILNSSRQTQGSIPAVSDLSRLSVLGQEQTGSAQSDRPSESGLPPYGLPTGLRGSPSAPAGTMERIDAVFSTQPPQGTVGSSPVADLPAVQRVKETARTFDATAKFLARPAQTPTSDGPAAPGRLSTLPDSLHLAAPGGNPVGGVAPANPPGTPPNPASQLVGDRIVQKYANQNPRAVPQEKFERYMTAGETYLREGQFRNAANAFTLASNYRPTEARAYLGRSHALLGAGEYLNSAVVLARALELDPRTTLAKTDLIEVLGGPDAFVARITGLEQCAKGGGAPQLQFLLAYIYCQMDQPAEAKAALEAATKALPASPALDLLQAAIGK